LHHKFDAKVIKPVLHSNDMENVTVIYSALLEKLEGEVFGLLLQIFQIKL